MKPKLLLAIALLWPFACRAADIFKPLEVKLGLWESSLKSDAVGMPPMSEEALAKLTPDQRARMEAAMKAQQGQGSQTLVVKSCLTSEDLNKPLTLGNDSVAACTRTVVSSSASRQEFRIECARGDMKSSGEVQMVALSPEAVRGTSKVTTTNGARTVHVHVTFTSKWLSADCGPYKKKK